VDGVEHGARVKCDVEDGLMKPLSWRASRCRTEKIAAVSGSSANSAAWQRRFQSGGLMRPDMMDLASVCAYRRFMSLVLTCMSLLRLGVVPEPLDQTDLDTGRQPSLVEGRGRPCVQLTLIDAIFNRRLMR
jgi:hypothetical protein